MIRSFPDSGVLIYAARSVSPAADVALRYLGRPDLVLLTSPFVRLEVLPKAAYIQRNEEFSFYQNFFTDPTVVWCRDWDKMEKVADQEARFKRAGRAAYRRGSSAWR